MMRALVRLPTAVAGAWSARRRSPDSPCGGRGRGGVGLDAGRELEGAGGGLLVATGVPGAAGAGRQDLAAEGSLAREGRAHRQGEVHARTGARHGIRRRS